MVRNSLALTIITAIFLRKKSTNSMVKENVAQNFHSFFLVLCVFTTTRVLENNHRSIEMDIELMKKKKWIFSQDFFYDFKCDFCAPI